MKNYYIHLSSSGQFMIYGPDNSIDVIGNHFPATYTGKNWGESHGSFDKYFFEIELPASLAKALKVPIKVIYCTSSGIVGPTLIRVLEVGQLQIFKACRHVLNTHVWYMPILEPCN